MSVVIMSLWDELRVFDCLKVLTSKNKEEKKNRSVKMCVCFTNSVAKIRESVAREFAGYF